MSEKTLPNQKVAYQFCQLAQYRGKLLFDRETLTYWLYAGTHWRMLSQTELRDAITGFIWDKDSGNRLTVGKVDDIINQLAQYLGDERSSVRGLSGYKVDEMEEKGISFGDGVLLFANMELVSHGSSLDRLAIIHLPFSYSDIKDAKCPKFDSYLKTTCTDAQGKYNEGMARQLQEVAGWIISDERAEMAVILQGEGGNGKSPYLDLLRAAVGKERCSALSLDALSKDKFSVPRLVGMKLNAKSEDESKGINLALLKEIISGEPIDARRLYQESFSFRPRAKLIFSTNNPPQVEGLDKATKRRLFLILFEHTMEKKDYNRTLAKQIIRDEFPGVMRWMFEGMRLIKESNCVFTETEQSLKAMSDFEEANSSVLEFLRINYEPDSSCKILACDIYAHYLEWCKKSGRKNPVTSNKFGRQCTPFLGKSKIDRSDSGNMGSCYQASALSNGDQLPIRGWRGLSVSQKKESAPSEDEALLAEQFNFDNDREL